MKHIKSRLLKSVIAITVILIASVLLILLLLSPISKYLIEKYSVKYTGRKVMVGWVYVNPFSGHIHLQNLSIYENKQLDSLKIEDTIFLKAAWVSADFSVGQLFSKSIAITSITLDHPTGTIVQKGRTFNFSDLIKRFTPKETGSKSSGFRFSIAGIRIISGEFHYYETETPVRYFIRDVLIESSGKRWKSDTISASFSFASGMGAGVAKGWFFINLSNLDYRFSVLVNKYNLEFIGQYLRGLTYAAYFSAAMDANIQANGNFLNQENVDFRGLLVMNDLHFGETKAEDYAAFKKIIVRIEHLNPKGHQYLFDSIILEHPYFKFERYDYLDNLQAMFGKNGSNISETRAASTSFNVILIIADYVKVLARNFFRSDYKIRKLAIYHGQFLYNDYSLNEEFSIEANPLLVLADSISKEHKRVSVMLQSGIKPYGNVRVDLSINPNDSSDFDIHYHLQGLPVSLFNPYTITYTSFPLDRGTLELNGDWTVRNGIISSNNHLLLIDPRLAKRIRNKENRWIPLPLVMAFIRERGNLIDYEIPITGNLKNPKFHLKDAIIDLLGNIFVKPATTPYQIQVRNAETEIEKSLTISWKLRQSNLLEKQEKFVIRMAEFLESNPGSYLSIYPIHYEKKEKEQILFYEAKKKYLLNYLRHGNTVYSRDDSLAVELMSVRDSSFVRYLVNKYAGLRQHTIQEKCSNVISETEVNSIYRQLNKQRLVAVMEIFKKKDLSKQLKFYPAVSLVPYNGYSNFKIVYKGDLPKKLLRAYQEMSNLDNAAPRKWFKREREKNKIRAR
ncbi:MAG: DUF748 domain-containing protein [Bacteroidetes bacterium]|nr:DUF748 domain-containing protein [Bacteroidota bacterium]